MNNKIDKILEELRQAFIESTSDNIVTVNVFINCEGVEYKIGQRTPEQLKKEGISMRNISGDFVQ